MTEAKKSDKPAVPAEVRVAEAAALKKMWEEHSTKPSQEAFGEAHGLGGQSHVSQFLNGKRPLHLKAAIAFAEELGCELEEFSPRLAADAKRIRELGGQAMPDHLSFLDLSKDEKDVVGWYRAVKEADPKLALEIHQHVNSIYANATGVHGADNPFPAAARRKEKAKV